MKRLAGAMLLLLAGAVAQTQQELTDEACGKYKEADADMTQVYERILKEYQKDADFIPKLRAAQRAWLTFRDAHLAALYPREGAGAHGNVQPMCRCAILAQLTLERTQQLRDWLDGTQEGDVCAGSIRINK
jgi:uncharacterized protein YecT (DUF1311 family)